MNRQPPQRWQAELASGDRISVLVRPVAINLLVNDEHPSFTFDPAGRLHGAFYQGRNYRRSLDNRVLNKWSEESEGTRQRQRRWLDRAEARALVELAHGLGQQAADEANAAPAAIRDALARVSAWDWPALEQDRERFEGIYSPIGILPPDQYLALVLQATHGCSHNACTFCTFYRDIPFQIRGPDEFREHVAQVLAFLGPSLAMRRSLFLADANALVVPMPRLLALLDALETSMLRLPIHAFIDAFHVHRKSTPDWQLLKARGLQRVTIGMESGHDPLLRWLNKPGTAADVLDAVRTLKEAGLEASVILMLGAGGQRFAAGHVQDTVALLNAMPLARGDLIYLSDFVEQPDAPYHDLAIRDGIEPLDYHGARAQEAALRAGFVPLSPQAPPQFARYDIREFVY